MNTPQQLHVPVLLDATLACLTPKQGETYLDLTAGYGGHAKKVIERIGDARLATLVDRDSNAIRELQPLGADGAQLLHTDFASAVKQLFAEGKTFDMILIDLGVSSPQLDRAERGFAFSLAGPLDMRMDDRESKTAAEVVNTYSQQELERIIRVYGEDPQARHIARAIAEHRPFVTTDQLADVIKHAVRGKWGKAHPATRTFQAIRIELNRELDMITQTLPYLPKLLKPGGRVAIISFHSLEDRLVKQFLAEQAAAGYEAELALLTKKPISGSTDDVHNPRARSAKLRAAVKIKIERT